MAKNIVFEDFQSNLSVVCSDPATPASGDVVRYGDRVGIALTDERDDGTTTVKFTCVADVPVKGVNGSGNSAVADGDVLYYVDADTPKLSKKATGTRAGIAQAAVSSGGTATIRVAFI